MKEFLVLFGACCLFLISSLFSIKRTPRFTGALVLIVGAFLLARTLFFWHMGYVSEEVKESLLILPLILGFTGGMALIGASFLFGGKRAVEELLRSSSGIMKILLVPFGFITACTLAVMRDRFFFSEQHIGHVLIDVLAPLISMVTSLFWACCLVIAPQEEGSRGDERE